MEKSLKILGISGSLRKGSYNRGLLRAAALVAPTHCSIEIFDLTPIPIYNQDQEKTLPPAVQELKAKIKAADGLLIAVPEYNYSFSGVLKNALDWGSRPYGQNAWDGKPVALMGASAGAQGTSRAQYHLRQVMVTLNMYPLNRPEVMIPLAQDKFNEQGDLLDEENRQRVARLLEALVASIKRGGGG